MKNRTYISHLNAGPVPVVSAIWEEFKIGEMLDSLLKWDNKQCKLSPGIRLKAIVINILAGRQDLANLFGKGVSASNLNDDCFRYKFLIVHSSKLDKRKARSLDKPPAEIFKEYKQQTTVETSFKFLKSPVFLDAIYLKKESRIEVLTYALFLALFIYQILQRRVRNALEAEGGYVTIAENVKTERPTGNRILELLKPIQVVVVNDGDKEYRIIPDIPNEEPLERILSLAGLTPDILYILL